MRVHAYIDGFNLYYGSLKGTQNRWLDIEALCKSITPKGATLSKIRYFTAKVNSNPQKPTAHTDQRSYLQAIDAHCNLVQIHYGHYQENRVRAPNANPPPVTVEIIKREEKGSDVNLAVHLVNDAFTAGINAAILISNDSDLAEAVTLARERGIEVYWYPPLACKGRYPSKTLQSVVTHQRQIYPNKYAAAQLPNPITTAQGKAINKPAGW